MLNWPCFMAQHGIALWAVLALRLARFHKHRGQAMAAKRNHNEWFRPVCLGNRKTCPNCRQRLSIGESIWSWGEYRNARWHTVAHFCRQCFSDTVCEHLLEHAGQCGCTITLVGKGCSLPVWLSLAIECDNGWPAIDRIADEFGLPAVGTMQAAIARCEAFT
jgi:hypothetical protein